MAMRQSHAEVEASEKTVKPVFEEGKTYRTRHGHLRQVGKKNHEGSFNVYENGKFTGTRYEDGRLFLLCYEHALDLLPGAIEDERGVINIAPKVEEAVFHCGRCGVIWSGQHTCTAKVPPEDPSSKRDREHVSEKPLAKRFTTFGRGYEVFYEGSDLYDDKPLYDESGPLGRSTNLDPKGLWK